MNDETTQPSEEQVETKVESQPTTEEVAKKYKVEEQAQEFKAQPREVEQKVESAPDPVYDPEGFQRYQQQISQQNTQLHGTLREIVTEVSTLKEQLSQERLNAEVNKAVTRVNEKLNIDPDYVEIALEKRYRDDQAFKRIWDNRTKNPKALEEALDVVTGELEGVFAVRQDPQLTENVRAARKSQQTLMKQPVEQKEEDEAMKLSENEFDLWWSRRKQGY